MSLLSFYLKNRRKLYSAKRQRYSIYTKEALSLGLNIEGTELHHWKSDPCSDDAVLCQDKQYHWLLHRRQNQLGRGVVVDCIHHYAHALPPYAMALCGPVVWHG